VKKVFFLSLFTAGICGLNGAHAVEVSPVVNAQLLGGQYFYNGTENAFGALASLSASPYMKFNDSWSLVPLYSGNYHGTRQVTDLIGGGTLFQSSMDHTGSAKVIRSFENGFKVKAIGGYSAEYLKETTDESWGGGLYDNRRASGGAEAEYSWDRDRFVRFSYDYYKITFPNYTSLESQGAASGLGRELNAPDVLNNNNHALTLGTQVGLPLNGSLETSLGYTWRRFPSEHLVDATDALVPPLRNDAVENFSIEGTWPVMVVPGYRLFGSLGYTWYHNYSNQNHYDAQQNFFNPNYYAYTQEGLQNKWTLAVGENPWLLSFEWGLSHQKYSDRAVQDAAGVYGTEATHVNGLFTGLTFSYPIAKGFRVTATAQCGWNDSNNHDNAVYQYHYNTQTYLGGFSYAY
jgi:hypothetical protein